MAATPAMIPKSPASVVSSVLSAIICRAMIHGEAPMARRMPISLVRSLTVTSMMLLTPTAPEMSVPKPMSQMSACSPILRYDRALSSFSALNPHIALSSSGAIWCRSLRTELMFFSISVAGIEGCATAMRTCTTSPRLATCWMVVSGASTILSGLPPI